MQKEFINEDNGVNTDELALNNGYISIVPVKFDMTGNFGLLKLTLLRKDFIFS